MTSNLTPRGNYRHYTLEQKKNAVQLGNETTFGSASEQLKIPKSTILTWKKEIKLGTLGVVKKNSRLTYSVQADLEIRDWVLQQRENQIPVTRSGLADYARKKVNKPGKRWPKELVDMPNGVHVRLQENGWMSENLMIQWLDNVIAPYTENKPTLLIMDSFSGHTTPAVMTRLEELNVTPVIIPGGCTSKEGLENLFLEYGNVLSAKKCQSNFPDQCHTFGFVSYKTTKEALLAIQKLDGFQITKGCTLNVRPAISEEERSKQKAQRKEEVDFLNSLTGQYENAPSSNQSKDNNALLSEDTLVSNKIRAPVIESKLKSDTKFEQTKPSGVSQAKEEPNTVRENKEQNKTDTEQKETSAENVDKPRKIAPAAEHFINFLSRGTKPQSTSEAVLRKPVETDTECESREDSVSLDNISQPDMMDRRSGGVSRGLGRGILAVQSSKLHEVQNAVGGMGEYGASASLAKLQPVQKCDNFQITVDVNKGARQIKTSDDTVDVPETSPIDQGNNYPPPRYDNAGRGAYSGNYRGHYQGQGQNRFRTPGSHFMYRPNNGQQFNQMFRGNIRQPFNQTFRGYSGQPFNQTPRFPKPQQFSRSHFPVNQQRVIRGDISPRSTPDDSLNHPLSDSGSQTSENTRKKKKCKYCGKPGNSKCKVCKTPYCSRKCQEDDWKNHKKDCQKISEKTDSEGFDEEYLNGLEVSVNENFVQTVAKYLDDTEQQEVSEPEVSQLVNVSSSDVKKPPLLPTPVTPPVPIVSMPPSTTPRSLPDCQLPLNAPVQGFVTWLCNPCDLWVCQVADCERYVQLTVDITQAYSKAKCDTSYKPSKGDYCAAFYEVNMTWNRGRVLDVDQSSGVTVLFIDYGNTEVVSKDNIQRLHPSFTNMPPQAFHCTLQGFSGTQWSEKNCCLLKDIVKESTPYIINSVLWKDKQYVVEIFETEGKPSLNEQLLKAGCPQTEQQPKSVFLTKDLINLGDNIQPGDSVTVAIVHVVSPVDFKVHICDKQQVTNFKTFSKQLNTFYNAMSAVYQGPSVGELVVAQYSGDQIWYRAEVMEVTGDSAKLCFIDFGNKEKQPLKYVRMAGERCRKFPVQAIHCSLFGIKPADGDNWSPNALKVLAGLPAKLKAKVISRVQQKLVIEVYDGEDGSTLTSYLVKLGLATRLESSTAGGVDSAEGRLNSPLLQADTQQPSKATLEGYLKAKLPKDMSLTVVCCYVQDDGVFYAQRIDEQNAPVLQSILEIESRYQARPIQAFTPLEGQKVCAMFQGCWSRGLVTGVQPGLVTVFFVDYGNTETLPSNCVQELETDYVDFPAQAIKCKLSGCESQTWTAELTLKLKDMILDKSAVIRLVHEDQGCHFVDLIQDNASMNFSFITEMSSDKPPPSAPSSSQPSLAKSSLKMGVPTDGLCPVVNQDGTFFVQSIQEDNLRFLTKLDELGQKYTTRQVTPIVCSKGQIVCAKFMDFWSRGIVTEINPDSTVTVFFVDYGNTETLPSNCVQELDRDFLDIPVQAMKCKLSGCENMNWPEEMAAKLKTMIQDQKVTVNLVKEENDCSVVDISLNGQLVNPVFSPKVSPNQPSVCTVAQKSTPDVIAKSETSPNFVKSFLSKDSATEGFCPVVRQDGTFYIQSLREENLQHLTKLDELGQKYTTRQVTPIVCSKGQKVCARFMDFWSRGIVTEINPDSMVTVFFVDYGNTETLPSNCVQELDRDFLDIPVQAMKCKLSGCENMNWTEEMAVKLKTMIQDQKVTVNLVKEENDFSVVDISLNGQLVNPVFSPKVSPNQPSVCTVAQKSTPDVIAKSQTSPNFVKSFLPKDNATEVFCPVVRQDGTFFIQSLREENLQHLTKLDELGQKYTTRQITPIVCSKGQKVCARFMDFWSRGVVTEINPDSMVTVFFVDYGNTETLPSNCVQELDRDFLDIPVQAIKCKLSGCENMNWSKEMAAKLKTTIQDQKVTVNLVKEEIDCSVVDISLNGQLVNPVFSPKVSPNQPSVCTVAQKSTPDVIAKSQTSPNFVKSFLPKDNVTEGFCPVVRQDGTFFIQSLREENLQHLTKLDELGQKYTTRQVTPIVCSKGQKVCARFMDFWSRGIVTEINPDSTVTVFFVDYGNTETLPSNCVQELDRDFLDIPVQAMKCKLSGCENMNWPEEMATKLKTMIQDQKVTVNLVKEENDCSVVDISLNGQLVNPVFSPKVSPNQPSVCTVAQKSTPDIIVKSQTLPNFVKSFLPKDNATEGFCPVVRQDGTFFIQSLREENLQHLTKLDELGQKYTTRQVTPIVCSKGQKVCAKFMDFWSRGIVTEINPDSTVTVFFVDYGNTETLPSNCVQELDRDFLDIPVQAIKCKLSGCENMNWTEEMAAKLKTMIQDKKVSVTFVKELGNTSFVTVNVGNMDVNQTILSQTTLSSSTPPVPDSGKTPLLTTLELIPGQSISVSCPVIETDGSFYVQVLSETNRENLERLCQMDVVYQDRPVNVLQTYKTLPGELVSACFMGSWCRAKVRKVLPDKSVQVFFVDYGNTETLPGKDVLELDPEFKLLPAQAVKCVLEGYESFTWSKTLVELLSDMIMNKVILITPVREIDGCYSVKVEVEGIGSVTDSLRKLSPPDATTLTELGHGSVSQKEVDLQLMTILSPKEFYCVASSAEAITNEVHSMCEALTYDSSFTPNVDDLCCALYPHDNRWYRAAVLDKEGSTGQYEVLYLDYGDRAIVQHSGIRKSPVPFTEPPSAIHCILPGVSAKDEVWPAKAIEVIQSCSEQPVHLEILNVVDGCHEVRVFLKEVDIGAVLQEACGGRKPQAGGDSTVSQAKEDDLSAEALRRQNEELKNRLRMLEDLIAKQSSNTT